MKYPCPLLAPVSPGHCLSTSFRAFWLLFERWICYPQIPQSSTVQRGCLPLPPPSSQHESGLVYSCIICVLVCNTMAVCCSFVTVHQLCLLPGLELEMGILGMAGRHSTGWPYFVLEGCRWKEMRPVVGEVGSRW